MKTRASARHGRVRSIQRRRQSRGPTHRTTCARTPHRSRTAQTGGMNSDDRRRASAQRRGQRPQPGPNRGPKSARSRVHPVNTRPRRLSRRRANIHQRPAQRTPGAGVHMGPRRRPRGQRPRLTGSGQRQRMGRIQRRAHRPRRPNHRRCRARQRHRHQDQPRDRAQGRDPGRRVFRRVLAMNSRHGAHGQTTVSVRAGWGEYGAAGGLFARHAYPFEQTSFRGANRQEEPLGERNLACLCINRRVVHEPGRSGAQLTAAGAGALQGLCGSDILWGPAAEHRSVGVRRGS